jgi:structural maintenance of chromosome 1
VEIPIHLGLSFPPSQKPELMAVEASIAHSSRKLNNAQNLREQISKEVEKQATKVGGYQGDLQSVQKAANEAQGEWQAHVRASFF